MSDFFEYNHPGSKKVTLLCIAAVTALSFEPYEEKRTLSEGDEDDVQFTVVANLPGFAIKMLLTAKEAGGLSSLYDGRIMKLDQLSTEGDTDLLGDQPDPNAT